MKGQNPDKVMIYKIAMNSKMKIFIFQNLVNVYIILYVIISMKNSWKKIKTKYYKLLMIIVNLKIYIDIILDYAI